MEPSTSNDLSASLAASQKICWFDKLPMEILKKIFNLLTDIEQVRCETVCKKWFNIFQSFWLEYDGFHFKSYFFPDVTILRGDKIAKTFSVRKLSPASTNEDIFKWCIRQGGSSFTNVEIENVVFKSSGPFSFMLEKCSKLKSLTIDNVSFDCFFENRTSEALLTTILSKENLTHLSISNCLSKDFQIDKPVGQSDITHLKLKSFSVHSNEFPILCQCIASNLKCFCFKWSKLDLESLVNGLRYLNNIENLNMEFRSWGFGSLVLEDDTLRDLAGCLRNLKILSLSRQTEITSAGICYILQSSFGRNMLTNLNIEYCSHINDQIYEGLKDRLADSPVLNIAAFGSNISSELVNRSNESSRWVVVIDKITEENIYFGEEKKACDNEEEDDEESGGLGYDSDGEHHHYHIDHDVDFDDFYDHDGYDDEEDYEVDDDDDVY